MRQRNQKLIIQRLTDNEKVTIHDANVGHIISISCSGALD